MNVAATSTSAPGSHGPADAVAAVVAAPVQTAAPVFLAPPQPTAPLALMPVTHAGMARAAEVNQAVVALKDSPIANATTLAELQAAKLGAQVGTAHPQARRDHRGAVVQVDEQHVEVAHR